jgi:hypothetical protein
MADFSITDNLGNKLDGVDVQWTSASSLCRYLKSELLHLMVYPDFKALKDKPIAQAASEPIQFQLQASYEFQLGNTKPEIDFTPGVQATLRANAKAGSDLFKDDPFPTTATVPQGTAYVGLALKGSLDLGVSGSAGDLTFGFEKNSSVTIEYLRAFRTGANEPSLGKATGEMLSNYVIPGDLTDLRKMNVNDICTVSGQGSLKVSGGFTVSVPVNPLASVNLPLGVGTIAIQDGAMTGVSASLTITGSFQMRVRRLGGVLELSYLRQQGETLKTDLTASAGISANLGSTDLLAKLLGAISKDEIDQKLLSGLTTDEVGKFTKAVKDAADHSLRASLDLALSQASDNQAVFQYEIHPEQLNAPASEALHRALEGDLSALTTLEASMQADGTLLPGIRMLHSVLTKTRASGVSLSVNLLGIVNLVSVSELIRKCEFLTEPGSGGLTIRETVEGDHISAMTNPLERQEKLRKALFNSVLVTTTYRASKAVQMPTLRCQNIHFALNQNTNPHTLMDYLNWFVALKLLSQAEKEGLLPQFSTGGPSSCLMRTEFNDQECESLFFDEQGKVRPRAYYLEIGRQALRDLLTPQNDDLDGIRYRFFNDPQIWQQAVSLGPSPQLAELIPLAHSDDRFHPVLADIRGDLYNIIWWADGMVKAGKELLNMREFLAMHDAISLKDDHDFARHRARLQKLLANVVKESQLRFDEPWGMVCLFRASGSRQSSGKLVSRKLSIVRPRP